MNEIFRKFSQTTSEIVGSPWAFVTAVVLIVVWAITGPIFKYSDTWQLVINTSTTIITFLIVFLIQNSQNRESKAINLKLDELIHGEKGARNKVIGLEEMADEELEKMYEDIHQLKENRRKQKK